MKKIIITIDGYSSCGKSTLAKKIAKDLNYVFVDSGAMYRAVTHYFLKNHLDWTIPEQVVDAINHISLKFEYNAQNGTSDILLNGENVEAAIREMIINENVSDVAAIKEVRDFTVAEQQKNAIEKGIVMDGRDIGTVVFPNAELKIFLTASPEARVERRYKQLLAQGKQVTREEVRLNNEKRDYIDTHREISPLRKAADAIEIDNTHLTTLEQEKLVMDMVFEKLNN